MTEIKRVIVLLTLFYLGFVPFVMGASADSLALKKFSTEHDTGVEMTHEGCRASLERSRVDPDFLRLRFSHVEFRLEMGFPSGCHFLSIDDRVVLLGRMIEMLVPDPDDRRTIHFLSVGRIEHTFPEVAQRLAKTAGKHPDWPGVRKRNRISPGAAEGFVSQIGNEAKVFPEIESALAPVGYRVYFAQMEKVLIRPAKKLPYHEC